MTRSLWIIVLCGGTVMALSLGLRQSLGLFLTPVSADLGIGRETFALAMGLMNLCWGLASPFAGAVADRHGAGRVAALGGLCYAAGLAAMTLSGDGGQLVLGGLLIGLGLSGAGFSVILGTVGRAAPPEKRSLALGVASMGGSIGQFAALPYSHAMIDGFGWLAALLVLALTALLIVPLAAGVAGRPAAAEGADEQTLKQAFDEAWGNRSFQLLNAGFFVCGFQLAFIIVHLPAYLADQGFAPWLAVAGLTLIGLCNVAGSYVCGLLGGWYSKKNLLSLLYLARALIFLLFLAAPVSEASVLLFSAAIGFLWLGTVPLTSGLVAQIFGTAHMSMLFGVVFLGHQFGGFLGAWLAGRLYDLTGAYDAVWWLTIALGLAAAALHWPIAERPVARLATAGQAR
jgi:predicted MFS family arabinose efflux permease